MPWANEAQSRPPLSRSGEDTKIYYLSTLGLLRFFQQPITKQKDQRANNGNDETTYIEAANITPAELYGDKSPDDGADDPNDSRYNKSSRIVPRHDELG